MIEEESETKAVPANIKVPKIKWEISMSDANEYGLSLLQSALPYLIAIFLLLFVSDYLDDWSSAVNDDGTDAHDEQTQEVIGALSILFELGSRILSIGLIIGLSYKVIGDAVMQALKTQSKSQ